MTSSSAEEGFEDLIRIDVAAEASVTSAALEVVDIVAVVVTRSLLGVGEDAVGLADLLEFLLVLLLLLLGRAGVTIWREQNGNDRQIIGVANIRTFSANDDSFQQT